MKKRATKKKPAAKKQSPANDIVHRELVVVQAALAILPALIPKMYPGDEPILKRDLVANAWELAEAFVDEGVARLDPKREPPEPTT